MSKMMRFRRIEISIGMWEDKPSFDIKQQEIVEAMFKAFPGAQVGISDDFTHTYEAWDGEYQPLGGI